MIGIASDHRGFKLKEKIKKYLDKRGIQYIDYGTNSEELTDYNEFAYSVCKGILDKEIENGILICGTGIGMSIAANKVKGIMAAKVDNSNEARLAKEHNNANIICFSGKKCLFEAKDIVDAYLSKKFLGEEKYINRINKIKELETKRSYK